MTEQLKKRIRDLDHDLSAALAAQENIKKRVRDLEHDLAAALAAQEKLATALAAVVNAAAAYSQLAVRAAEGARDAVTLHRVTLSQAGRDVLGGGA